MIRAFKGLFLRLNPHNLCNITALIIDFFSHNIKTSFSKTDFFPQEAALILCHIHCSDSFRTRQQNLIKEQCLSWTTFSGILSFSSKHCH